jgi:hypothetical protein
MERSVPREIVGQDRISSEVGQSWLDRPVE